MPTDSRLLEIHRAWLGLLQPVGLVVSPPALEKAGLVPIESAVELQERLLEVVGRPDGDAARGGEDSPAHALDLTRLLEHVLGWRRDDLLGPGGWGDLPSTFDVALPNYGEVLRPTWAAQEPGAPERALLLIQQIALGQNFDEPPAETSGPGWHTSPEAKFERLLSDSGVRIGLLTNGLAIRMVYVPEHQTSGHLTFPIQAMTEVGGRPILAAFHMLLREGAVFNAPPGKSLAEVLADSRNFQNEVSNKLSEQVLGALWELLRGFQEADVVKEGSLLHAATSEEREHIYGGLLTTLMRLVFLLYAEDQGLLPDDPVWVRNYSVAGLARRLRDDQGANPDTMDHRYGAWASLLALFRVVYHGGGHQLLRLPARKGQLFDPDAYPFLEGRARGTRHERAQRIEAPHVPDGCVHRVLQSLLILDGERLSYRSLDVEQIGSVYEAMMGYVVERMEGPALALKFSRKGSPGFVFFDVAALLARPARERVKWLEEHALCELPAKAAAALREATTPEGVLAAVERRVSPRTPRVLPKGALVLQPGEERRRSGSHYTPRSLTKPIVQTTLDPVLVGLGENPTAEQILELKVCDPAMGSGAFLVEVCRQLAERVVEAWDRHGATLRLPADETPLLYAKRIVAQRCLYGVDKNPFAVSLAKLSVWLVTLARDHAFTFVDHALKHGDSLVGLDLEQIGKFHWERGEDAPLPLFRDLKRDERTAAAARQALAEMEDDRKGDQSALHERSEHAQMRARALGDAVIAAFFAAESPKVREHRRKELRDVADGWSGAGGPIPAALLESVVALRHGPLGTPPFHWSVEFPEVFDRVPSGFDAIVGNPPFAGTATVARSAASEYPSWLRRVWEGAGGKCDLVAYFFRRGFALLRERGALGLIATKSISQGDTRASALRPIRSAGGTIFCARRRMPWPGAASVIVSVVHIAKGNLPVRPMLDGKHVERITAFLYARGGDDDPERLTANANRAFLGCKPGGMGFIFEDGRSDTTPLSVAQAILAEEPRYAHVIKRYVGGSELNASAEARVTRMIIDFSTMDEDTVRRYPKVLSIIESKVRPLTQRRRWWRFSHTADELTVRLRAFKQVLVCAESSNTLAFLFYPSDVVFSNKVVVILADSMAAFAVLQSRLHETWARTFSATTAGDNLAYVPSDCFESFPFPPEWDRAVPLASIGEQYYAARSSLLATPGHGLTAIDHLFHDPHNDSPAIVRLRELRAEMDYAVLSAYGWADLRPQCEFIPEDETEREISPGETFRLRWPDGVRDEVLARLLELNRARAEQERLAGPYAKRGIVMPLKPRTRKVLDSAVAEGSGLFGTSATSDESAHGGSTNPDEEQR
ncbi:MAG: N-6 DNA methylase [Planctomycetes bacterium]|nr:N-6 DNA methylase [Planctomycetota bacterium]